MLVKHVALKPNLRVERRAHCQRVATQGALVHKNFQLDAFEIEMDPNQFLT